MYGAFLRTLRRSRGLTQAELGEIVRIAVPNLSAYENDRQLPSIDVVNRIVAACGCRLVVEGSPGDLSLPAAKGGWTPPEAWPERDPDDPGESGPPLAFDAPMEQRLDAIERALGIPDMVVVDR